MAKHTLEELQQWQALPLGIKIRMTEERIRDWVREYGEDGVYVSFSGGKDSTVLLDIVRKLYPSIVAVFVDTGLEYPEIREFVLGFENVEWLKPKMNFKQVIEKYGYPFISKEVSQKVSDARKNPNGYAIKSFNGERKPPYDYSKWSFLLESPFMISHNCCNVMKKSPTHEYAKRTNRKCILGTMASESQLRTQKWLIEGCNAYDSKNPTSKPMSFWTEQDVLLYIKENNLPIASVYGDIEIDWESYGHCKGQLSITEIIGINGKLYELTSPPLKTTGCSRTGCMFCGFGCHLEASPNRFERMKETHPKQYDYIMRPKEQGGLNYKEVIDWINEHGNMNIKY